MPAPSAHTGSFAYAYPLLPLVREGVAWAVWGWKGEKGDSTHVQYSSTVCGIYPCTVKLNYHLCKLLVRCTYLCVMDVERLKHGINRCVSIVARAWNYCMHGNEMGNGFFFSHERVWRGAGWAGQCDELAWSHGRLAGVGWARLGWGLGVGRRDGKRAFGVGGFVDEGMGVARGACVAVGR